MHPFIGRPGFWFPYAGMLLLLIGCGNKENVCPRTGKGCATVCDRRGVVSIADATALIDRPLPSKTPIPVTLTAAVAWSSAPAPSEEAVGKWFQDLVKAADAAFVPCDLALDVQRVEAAAVPSSLLSVLADTEASRAGSALEGEDPIRFNQALNERLTDDVKTLFRFARRGMAPGVIAVVIIDEIRYFSAQKPAKAGGFSFPPVIYHHPEDIPLRNGVLVASGYRRCGSLPIRITDGLLAHELGHMLLDQPVHDTAQGNLMRLPVGKDIRPDQCARMRRNLKTLYMRPDK